MGVGKKFRGCVCHYGDWGDSGMSDYDDWMDGLIGEEWVRFFVSQKTCISYKNF